jgi:amidase
MTRRVEDTALTLQCIAGPDGSDPRQRSMPEIPDYSSLLDRGVDGLRIGILDEGFGYPGLDADVNDAVLAATDVLRGAGATVTRISVPAHTDAYVPASIIMAEGTRYLFDSNLGGTSADTYYPISLITAFGRFKQAAGYELPLSSKLNATFAEYLHDRYHGRFYAKAQNVRGAIRRAYDAALAEVDLLICPTKPTTAPRYVEPTNYVEEMEYFLSRGEPGNAAFSRNTAPFNYTGHPAISVPCAAVNGMPVGMQLVGRHFEDDIVLRAAYAFQEASGFVILPDTGHGDSTTTTNRSHTTRGIDQHEHAQTTRNAHPVFEYPPRAGLGEDAEQGQRSRLLLLPIPRHAHLARTKLPEPVRLRPDAARCRVAGRRRGRRHCMERRIRKLDGPGYRP